MLAVKYAVLITILCIITYTDFKRQEIDNWPLLAGMAFIIPFSLLGYNDVFFMDSIIGFLIGGIFFSILGFWGMGGGDIKLMAMIGFFLGWKLTIVTIVLSFLVGLVFVIFYVVFKKAKLKDHIPFGPSIAIATIITIFFGQQIIFYYQSLFTTF